MYKYRYYLAEYTIKNNSGKTEDYCLVNASNIEQGKKKIKEKYSNSETKISFHKNALHKITGRYVYISDNMRFRINMCELKNKIVY